MTGRGREALLQGREGSGGLSEGPGEVGRPTQCPIRGWEDHPEVQKSLLEVREGLVGPNEGPGGFVKPTRRN